MFKTILISTMIAIFNSFFVEEEKGELYVKVEGIKEVDGEIGILLFNQSEGFPDSGEKAYINKKIKVTAKEMSILLGEFPFGDYAIAIVHDVNANKKFDKNFLGIPKEPFGFSNNKSIFLGLPDFQEASVQLREPKKETVIKLIDL